MTIKQYGGVFGRNPTFNDVTIEGDLIINGEVFSGLDFQGSWNASTNSPALASSTGTKGEFYIVSVAGTTSLDGITNWGIGDWALFNGAAWQRVEGGANGNFVDLTASGTSTFGNVRASANTITTADTNGNLLLAPNGSGQVRISNNDVITGTTVVNPASGFTDVYGMGWSNANKELQISSDSGPLQLGRTSTGGDGWIVIFRKAATVVGNIAVTASSTAYNTSSDYRLKENVVGLTGATERLKQLKPSRFNFILNKDNTVDGFLAHEAQEIVPECVTGIKDAMRTEDGIEVPDYQGIDQSKLVPLLVATIQELEARITALEA